LVVPRSEDCVMIPAFDMYSHRNGEWFNTQTDTEVEVNHVTKATRVIEAGEQIYVSYNQCEECEGRDFGYGTGEILRDYGFVEDYPQRWHYMATDMQFEIDENEDTGEIELTWDEHIQPSDDDHESKLFLRRQIRRLRRIKNIEYKDGKPEAMADHEWDISWKFQQANIVAMTAAIKSLEEMDQGEYAKDKTCSAADLELCLNVTKDMEAKAPKPHYDALGFEADDLDYNSPNCDNNEIMRFADHDVVAQISTHYQTLNFAIHPETKDVVMDLDDIVQISSNYRPHYHEYVVHAAARFVDKVKRVIFIGGGDSMLLHETLKYPELELVVGLELDQVVTRNSFKYFHTQPHFDDPRVEWWFGDATKSLLLLPEDYWASFDLVLVDLSETVMSLSVTNELDVFDALALLLTPDGVMVKNELYLDQFSKVFDYTTQIYYECPVICSQALAMGSNKVDFLHDIGMDHGVETLLYEPLITTDNRFEFLHDYRKNDARAQGTCGELPKREDETKEQSNSAGVMEIVDAENTSVPLDEKITDKFTKAVRKQGFHLITLPTFDNGVTMIEMKEGYIIARMWPEKNYCAFDINLWGSFHKLKSLSKALTDVVGSKLVSSYRIAVGGMYGSSTWKEDRKIVGPQIIRTRNCEETTVKEGLENNQELIQAAFEESLNLVHSDEIKAGVLCGTEDNCLAADLLGKKDSIRKVVKVSTCPGIDMADAAKMYECEIATESAVKEALGNTKLDLFVIDGSVPYAMLQIMNSILSVGENRKAWIEDDNVFMAWSTTEEEAPRNFLDRYRKQHAHDPIARGEFHMQTGGNSVEFGVVTCGDDLFAYNLETIELKLREKFQEAKMDVSVELRQIQGGLFHFVDDFEPIEFLQSDYDNRPGEEQYFLQKPMGHQTMFQLEPKKHKVISYTHDELNGFLGKSLDHVRFKITSHHLVTDVGDGALMVYTGTKGSVILTWDGRKHIDINVYLKDPVSGETETFMGVFLHFTGQILKVALRDDMPRGTGRVVTFPEAE
jgi:spermidine synthase